MCCGVLLVLGLIVGLGLVLLVRRYGCGRWRCRSHVGGPWQRFFADLGVGPEQERVIRKALEELREGWPAIRDELRRSRRDVAEALRQPEVDVTALGELFGRHDSLLEALRKRFVGALEQVHEALDEAQRRRLADALEKSGFWSGGQPYRNCC